MGDRANVFVKESYCDNAAGVYLYTHCEGTRLPLIVKQALIRAERKNWLESQYLARIIFCEMVKGWEMSTNYFGISAVIWDNEHPVIVVNCDDGTIGYAEEKDETRTPGKAWRFEEFVTLPDEEILQTYYTRDD